MYGFPFISAALQIALGCAKAKGASSNKMPGGAGDATRTKFPRNFMDISSNGNSTNATAYPLSDAQRALPVAGVSSMQAGNINLRQNLFVGCWNVRTLTSPESQILTIKSLFDYHIDIACLSEVRLAGVGSRSIKIPEIDACYRLYHSGPDDNSGLHGVAFALNTRAQKALISWIPISSRISMARFKGSPINTTVIATYAPTLPSDAETKNEFYTRLQETVDTVPKRDMLIIAGDWNARVGAADDSETHVIGKYGLGQRCENGDRLLSFAATNHLYVANTRFQHPKKHLLTWYSNDRHTANQIDYILVRKRWMSSVEDCRSYRGAEAGNKGGSDHVLVRARLKLHLSSRPQRRATKKVNVAQLQLPEKREALTTELLRELGTGGEDTSLSERESPDLQWFSLKSALQKASSNILGTTKRQKKDWITQETLRLSTLAKDARLSNAPEYRRLRREATRSARRDRNRYWANLATEMEAAATKEDYGALFRLIRCASGYYQPPNPLLRDSSGQFIPELSGKVQRWAEYFTELLNRPSTHPPNIDLSTNIEYNASCESPSREEISTVVDSLKTKKSPGEDGIPSEIYKTCLPTLLDPLHKLISTIWEREEIPSDWHTSILLPLPKKGDMTKCENYRGISLLDVAAKLFATILLKRFLKERDKRVRPNQCGFRPGRGCVDQIFTLRRILEHRYKFQQPTTACFIDFRAAFDSVDRDALWNIVMADGMPVKLLNLIKAYYASTKARVRVYGEESTNFSLTTGVRQGCPLSPVLFNYAVDWTMRNALDGYQGIEIEPGLRITDLDFADDIVILSDQPENLQPVLNRITHFASAIGLQINVSKTKVFTTVLAPSQSLHVRDETVELVSSFKYLGSTILPNGQAKEEVTLRINHARRAFSQLSTRLWRRKEITLRTKVRVYKAAIRPVLLYASETWPLRAEDIRKLEVFDHWCMRYVLKVKWHHKVPNTEIRQRFGNIKQLHLAIQRRRLQWFGHLLRKPVTEISRLTVSPKPHTDWRCRLGGQLKTWLNVVKTDIECLGYQNVYGVRRWNSSWLSICENLASDRQAWSATIRDVQEAGSSQMRRQPR